MKNEKNDKKETTKIIAFFLFGGVLLILYYIFRSQVDSWVDLLWVKIQEWRLKPWLIPGILWIIGLFAWIVTYIGAPRASKKSGHFVSGIPGVAFVFWLAAGLLSPCKWLAVLALADYEIVLLPIKLIFTKEKKDKK